MLSCGRRRCRRDLPVEGVGEGLYGCAISYRGRHGGRRGYRHLTILVDERN